MRLTSDEKVLKRLSKLKLRVPKDLIGYMYGMNKSHTPAAYDVVETMEKWNGLWVLRVFAFNAGKKSKITDIKIVEVQRKLLGIKKYLSSDIVTASTMGQRKIHWDEKPGFIIVDKNWEFFGHEMFNEQKTIDDLKIPYCQWSQYKKECNTLRFIDYISLYIDEPRIERLVKMGYSKFVSSLRNLDLSQRRIYKVFKLEKQWEPYIKDFSIQDIYIARQKGVNSIEDIKLYKNIYCDGVTKTIKKYTDVSKVLSYFRDNNLSRYDNNIYSDYLTFAAAVGYQMNRNDVLHPNNLKKAHDKAYKEYEKYLDSIEIEKKQEEDTEIYKQYKKNKKHNFASMGLMIKVAKSYSELIEESKALGHCVRTYSNKIAAGESEVLFIRNEEAPETPLVTVEVVKKKVVQVRGKNNSVPNESIKEFVKLWSEEMNINYAQ